MDQGTVNYQVWNDDFKEWVAIPASIHQHVIERGRKVRWRTKGDLIWHEPGMRYRIDGDLTT